jgi:hypothetical protein
MNLGGGCEHRRVRLRRFVVTMRGRGDAAGRPDAQTVLADDRLAAGRTLAIGCGTRVGTTRRIPMSRRVAFAMGQVKIVEVVCDGSWSRCEDEGTRPDDRCRLQNSRRTTRRIPTSRRVAFAMSRWRSNSSIRGARATSPRPYERRRLIQLRSFVHSVQQQTVVLSAHESDRLGEISIRHVIVESSHDREHIRIGHAGRIRCLEHRDRAREVVGDLSLFIKSVT